MKFFFKLCLLLTPLGLLIAFNIFYNLNHSNATKFSENAYYFIGSSRVQYGINPVQLNQIKKPIYNVGISAATFFNNVMLAEHLMQTSKPKELFIELSPIIYTFSSAQKTLGVKPVNALKHLIRLNSFHLKEILDILEIILFDSLSLKDNLKKIFISTKSNLSESNSIYFGYKPKSLNYYFGRNSFLQVNNLETKYNVDISEYTYYISYLTLLADKHNVKIRFFLPLTFNRQEEREIVCTVYQSLPDELKVKYTSEFIEKIRQPQYLFDKNHFNNKGAAIMTDYFDKLFFN